MSDSKMLVSQAAPMNTAPYDAVKEKFGVEIDFRPFYIIEPLTSREFRAQRLNILDYTAVVFSARHTIDAFFQLCDELRIKVPETMKYFCTTEAVAMYLQKHIIFRKRKIFYGNGTPQSVVDLIGPKHKGEKFLITTSGSGSSEAITKLLDAAKIDYTSAVFVKSVPQDLKDVDLSAYAYIVVYNPADLVSLKENFPDYQPGGSRFITFGKQIARAVEEAGLPVAINAPTPEVPSVAKAIEICLGAGK